MSRARGFVVIALLAFAVAAGLPGCGGAGCSCIAPYPAGVTMPASLIVENGIQVRLTDSGFTFLEQNIASILAGTLGAGLCLPPGSISLLATLDYCNDDAGRYAALPASSYYCADGSVGCPIGLQLNSMDFTLQAPNNILVDIDLNLDINMRLTVDCGFFGDTACASDCDLGGGSPACSDPAGRSNRIHADNMTTTATIAVTNDPTTRHLAIQLTDVSNLTLNLDIGSLAEVDSGGVCLGCGAVEVVGDIFTAVAGFIAPLIEGFIAGFLDGFVQGFVPDPPGVEGVMDVGALLGGIAPGLTAMMELSDIAGGDPGMADGSYTPSYVVNNGLEIGIRSAANADITMTDGMDGRSTPNPCVPARTFTYPPEIVTVPGRMERTLPFAAEFMMDSVPAGGTYDVGIGISEATLDAGAFAFFNSGGMCLAFGSSLSDMLNTGLFGLLVPSLSVLTHDTNSPMLMALRPLQPPDVTIGAGSDNDPSSPLLTIDVPDLAIDVYAFVEERYVRVFTMTVDAVISLDLDVQTSVDPVTGAMVTELVPVFDPSSSISFNNVRVSNNEIIAEQAATLEAILPTLISLAAPFLSGAIQPIPLPAFNGFVLGVQQITRVIGTLPGGATHPFLAIFATLGYDPAALIIDVDTIAGIGGIYVPVPGLAPVPSGTGELPLPGAFDPAALQPEVTLDLAADSAVPGAAYEWQYRVNGGLWTAWSSESIRVVRDPVFKLHGWHSIEVRSRIAGDSLSVDPTPARFDVLLDSIAPRADVRLDMDTGVLHVDATDLVSAPERLRYEVRWSDGTITTLDPDAPAVSLNVGSAGAAAAAFPVALDVIDEAGNGTTRNIDPDTIGFHQNTPTSGNPAPGSCGCAVVGGDAAGATGSGGAGLGLLVLGLAFWLRRRGANETARSAAGAEVRSARGRNLALLVIAVVGTIVLSGIQGCAGCCGGDPCDCTEQCGPMGGTCSGSDGTCQCNNPTCDSDADCAEFPCIGNGYPYCDIAAMMCACFPTIPPAEPGRYAEVGVSMGTAYISAYSDVLGDLMVGKTSATLGGNDRPIGCANDTDCPVARPCNRDLDHDGSFDACAPDITWEYVDGVPDELPTSDPTGERGGISGEGDDVGLYTSLAMSGAGNPAVSYYDRTNGDLKYTYFDGSSWSVTLVDTGTGFDADVGMYTSLTFDAAGAPGIAYFAKSVDNGAGVEVTQARFAQAMTATPVGPQSWVVYILAESPVPPPDPMASTLAFLPMGTGLFNSAARLSDGRPVVAFYDRPSTSVMLSVFDTAAGAFIVPVQLDGGINAGSGLDVGDAGQWVSLAIDSSDSFHLSYVDASRDDLVYLYVDGATGAATREVADDGLRAELAVTGETVNVFAFIGEDSSIVTDAATPYIVYQDATFLDLTYVSRDASVAGNPAAVWSAPQVLAGNSVKAYEGGMGFYADQVLDLTTGNAVIISWAIDQQVDPIYRGMLVMARGIGGL